MRYFFMELFCNSPSLPGTVKSYAQIRLQTLAENEVSRQ